MKILHVLSELQWSSVTRPLLLLLRNSPEPAATVHIYCLGREGPTLPVLRAAGATVESFGWTRWLDLKQLWTLARRVRDFQPDLIHACGLAALRAVRPVVSRSAVVVSHLLPGRCRRTPLSRLDRWLLQGVDAVLVNSAAEADRCRVAGVPAGKLRFVPRGVVVPTGDRQSTAASPTVACLGELQPHSGFYDAIWTLDILHFTHEGLNLVIAGDGPDRQRLEAFAGNVGRRHRIHFQPGFDDPGPLLAHASLVWVPSLADTGAHVALEAMVAGLPVIASRWPSLAETVVDGQTGFLVEPGNKLQLARQTRVLLEDDTLHQRMGSAARSHVARHFGPDRFVRSWFQACGALAA